MTPLNHELSSYNFKTEEISKDKTISTVLVL